MNHDQFEHAESIHRNIIAVLEDNNSDVDSDEDGLILYNVDGCSFAINIVLNGTKFVENMTNTAGTRKHLRSLAGLMMQHGYDLSFRANDARFFIDGFVIYMIDRTPDAVHLPKIYIENGVLYCGEYTIHLGGENFSACGIRRGEQIILMNAKPEEILSEFRKLGTPVSNSIQFILSSIAVQKG